MCGIVGVVGKPARDIILNGLTNLEYRGYDSAGIYLNDLNGNEYLTKAVGRISNLKEKLTPDEQGLVGIGHTRWATHGKPTVDNAHPHFDETKRFYLVHNGVIENYAELKEKYLQGVKFHSNTDTEVVVQLISKIAREKNLDGFSAFKKALKLVKGSYAFLLVDNTEPEHVFIAKNKSPMMLGLGDGFNIIASDAISVLDQTKTFVDLQDGDVGDITKDSYTIETVDGKKVERKPHVLDIDPNAASKGTYEFYMLKEIDEQPSVMRKISQTYFDENDDVKVDPKIIDSISKADRIYIYAAGTSYHAGLVGKTMLEHYTGIPTEVGLASEAGYHFPHWQSAQPPEPPDTVPPAGNEAHADILFRPSPASGDPSESHHSAYPASSSDILRRLTPYLSESLSPQAACGPRSDSYRYHLPPEYARQALRSSACNDLPHECWSGKSG